MKIEFAGEVINGVVKIRNRKIFDEQVKQLEGKQFEGVIEKKRVKRSLPQNAYYWAVVVPLIEERFKQLGHNEITKQLTHEFLKGKFLYHEIITEHSEVIHLPKGTSETTKSEFMDYIAKVQQWAAETLDLIIPEPSTQTSFDYQ